MDIFRVNFVYALVSTRSRLGLLPFIFRKFVTVLWPLNDIRILFPLNFLIMNGRISINFCICIDIGKIKFGIDMLDFSQILSRVMTLDLC